jgi:hypothetical protein
MKQYHTHGHLWYLLAIGVLDERFLMFVEALLLTHVLLSPLDIVLMSMFTNREKKEGAEGDQKQNLLTLIFDSKKGRNL